MKLDLQPKQTLAFTTPATELLYGGAAGGGKSHLLRAAMIIWCCEIPGLQCYLFRRKSPDLIKNHMEGPSSFPVMVGELVVSKHVKIVYSPSIKVEFWNGSTIHLCHCQHEKDRYNYQGAEIHVLCFDELTHFSETIYRYLRGRVRMVGVDLPETYKGKFPRVVAGSNPGGVGHNWVKATFVDIAKYGAITRMPKKEGGFLRQYIPALLEDNPALIAADPDYEDRLEALGSPDLVKAMRNGDWNIVAGGALDDVWRKAKHEIEPFDIPAEWTIDRSFDWGSSRPFAVCWWAESNGESLPDGRCWPKGTLFQIGEWYGWSGKPNEGAKLSSAEIGRGMLEREKTMGIFGRVLPGPADRSIFDVSPEGESIANKIDEAYGAAVFVPCDKGPGSRVNGLETLRGRLKAGHSWPMEEPGIFFFNQCRHSIRTLPTLPRDETKTDDVDTNAEDHIYDAVRYRSSAKKGRVVMGSKAVSLIIKGCTQPKQTYGIDPITGAMIAGGADLLVWEEPSVSSGYVVGACLKLSPPGQHVAFVVNQNTGHQVAMWRSGGNIEDLSRVLVLIAKRYCNAWIVPERDDLGNALIQSLIANKYMRIYTEIDIEPGIGAPQRKRKYGIRGKAKLDTLIELLGVKVRSGAHGIVDVNTAQELQSFRKGEDGKTEIEPGRTGERIVARAMIEHALNSLPKPRSQASSQILGNTPGTQRKPGRGGSNAWKKGVL